MPPEFESALPLVLTVPSEVDRRNSGLAQGHYARARRTVGPGADFHVVERIRYRSEVQAVASDKASGAGNLDSEQENGVKFTRRRRRHSVTSDQASNPVLSSTTSADVESISGIFRELVNVARSNDQTAAPLSKAVSTSLGHVSSVTSEKLLSFDSSGAPPLRSSISSDIDPKLVSGSESGLQSSTNVRNNPLYEGPSAPSPSAIRFRPQTIGVRVSHVAETAYSRTDRGPYRLDIQTEPAAPIQAENINSNLEQSVTSLEITASGGHGAANHDSSALVSKDHGSQSNRFSLYSSSKGSRRSQLASLKFRSSHEPSQGDHDGEVTSLPGSKTATHQVIFPEPEKRPGDHVEEPNSKRTMDADSKDLHLARYDRRIQTIATDIKAGESVTRNEMLTRAVKENAKGSSHQALGDLTSEKKLSRSQRISSDAIEKLYERLGPLSRCESSPISSPTILPLSGPLSELHRSGSVNLPIAKVVQQPDRKVRRGGLNKTLKGIFSMQKSVIYLGLSKQNAVPADLVNHRRKVVVNDVAITDVLVKQAEECAGPIHPGRYWYDAQAGFWGVENGPCVGIIPPFIPEFNYPMKASCSGGDTRIFVNGRELHQKDLEKLSVRGLPTQVGRSYLVSIDGRVVEVASGKVLPGLGKLAPSLEKSGRGAGIYLPLHLTI